MAIPDTYLRLRTACDAAMAYERAVRSSAFEGYSSLRVPTAGESADVQTHTGALLADISDLDSTLDSLHCAERSLRYGRSAMIKSLRMHEAILSVQRRLPPETWSEIFIHCRSSHVEDRRRYRTEIVIGHVCRRWREIALCTPQLWTVIDTDYDNGAHHLRLKLVENVWLPRSMSLPLDIRHQTFARNDCLYTTPFLEAMIGVSHRWRHVTLCLSEQRTARLMACVSSAGALESLELTRYDPDGHHPWRTVTQEDAEAWKLSPSWTLVAPCLRRAKLLHGGLTNQLQIPWSGLQQLEGLFRTWTDYVEVISSCPNLRVHAVDTGALRDHSFTGSIFVIPQIKELTVTCHLSCPSPRKYLRRVTLPSLEALRLDVKANWKIETILPDLHRSTSTLITLALHNGAIALDGLSACLAGIPSLRNLIMQRVNIISSYGSFFERLGVVNNSCHTCILPELETVMLAVFPHCRGGSDEQCLIDFVESRIREDAGASGWAPLKAFHLHQHSSHDFMKVRDRAKTWSANGFKVTLSTCCDGGGCTERRCIYS